MAVAAWVTLGARVKYDLKDAIVKLAEIEGMSISILLKASLAEYCSKRSYAHLEESKELAALAEEDSTPLVARQGFYGAGMKRTDKAELYLDIQKALMDTTKEPSTMTP